MLARILPFAIYLGFIGIEDLARLLGASPSLLLFLYPAKICAVGAALWHYRQSYVELAWKDLAHAGNLVFSILIGAVVFLLWIQMTWPFAIFGTLTGYDPTGIQDGAARMAIIASRLFGAAVIVPIMEELFWRSFVIRYIMNPDFLRIPIGAFSWVSFALVSVLFGLEHNLWLAGIMAGVAYNIVLYRTRSIAHCIVAHAVTNGMLGVYVVATNSWRFW
ncbi:MAG TPA: CAAX prenyl protease-related protein [Dissulfurispiraceae bacterium]|nr:CAAX prenyl protease-related protein [Dissulfurispiraceae bacterium]